MCVDSQKKSSTVVNFTVFLFTSFLQFSNCSDSNAVEERDPFAPGDIATVFPVSVIYHGLVLYHYL